ncbi:hypothetical protein BABINDRAFT_162776 [Babjeviella inositovora NRRL Y-12698]|uniref:Glutaredoxin domain-containing protein n=1 Tax=Babjeviella inositovora NRRL Y-12698 TaxID=984486 RepID=A0A1E3QLP4_9ASCO|nr:uncharacterized protein BABINDRAFT_162776 [Babjeviella inositovora NRRL Y-12698]ODQ78570.1 hypothetical protein BABINDRAFT_162776 [Babjeviella inositovora NRRL Y-12698]
MFVVYVVASIYIVIKMYQLFRRFFSTAPATDPAVLQKVQSLIASNAVFVASKSFCPYCSSTKQTLQKMNARAEILELDKIADGSAIQQALQEISGQKTVPNVFIGGKHVGGNSDVQNLYQQGSLSKLIEEATKK